MPTTAKDATIVVNARVDTGILAQLDELAHAMDRTRSYLIGQAIREFVEREYAHLCAVREGDADFDAGRYLTNEETAAWLEALKSGRVKGPPEKFPKRGRDK